MEAASTTSSAASSVDGRSVGGGAAGGSDFINRGMFASTGNNSQQQQQQQAATTDLLGSGGFALGNGFGNTDVSNLAAAAASSGTSFDLSDFPSLGGGAAPGTTVPGSGNGLAAALREQQQLLAHQQMLQQGAAASGGGSGAGKQGAGGSNLYMLAMTGTNGNFNMATEDFPALGGGQSVVSGSGSGLNVSSLLGNSSSVQPSSSNENGIYAAGGLESGTGNSSRLEGGAGGLLGGAGLGGLGGLRNNPASSVSAPPPSGSAPAGAIGSSAAPAPGSGGGGGAGSSAAGSALGGDYGLLGLLGVIRMTDADRNALALGTDLQMLGLNLGTTEQIYSTFSSPWSDGGAAKEPQYQLPMCYYMQPPALKTGHLSKFQLETLFYIFYALPKDVLQAYAAQELYSREWRYHGDLKLWFKRAGPSDGVANSSSGSPQYLYFDINSWERRLFNGSMNQNVTNGFLPEDEVRVKFPSS